MRSLGISLPVALLLFFWTSAASAQISLASSSIQTDATAVTPACSDTIGNGGVGVPNATASCSQPFGYTSAASSSASFDAAVSGGTLTAAAQAGATAPGDFPVNSSQSNAFANSFASWAILETVFYAVSITGSAPATVQQNGGVDLPPSGTLLAGDSLTASLNPNVFALASDTGPLTAAESESGSIVVTFASVTSLELVMGTVLGEGIPMAGLEVEALVVGTPVASTQTANDGSYLLPGLPGPVVLRFSDPAGGFVTELSPELTPPATYDADLAPTPSVPGLTASGLAILVSLCVGSGTALGARRSQR